MSIYNAYIVSMNEENLMTRHLRIGDFESVEEIFKCAENMEIESELLKIKNLFLAIAMPGQSEREIICSNHGCIPAIEIKLYKLKIENNNEEQ